MQTADHYTKIMTSEGKANFWINECFRSHLWLFSFHDIITFLFIYNRSVTANYANGEARWHDLSCLTKVSSGKIVLVMVVGFYCAAFHHSRHFKFFLHHNTGGTNSSRVLQPRRSLFRMWIVGTRRCTAVTWPWATNVHIVTWERKVTLREYWKTQYMHNLQL